MPAKRLLAHYKIDPKRNRLLMVACNAEDMLLPRSNFTFYGQHCTAHPLLKSSPSQIHTSHCPVHLICRSVNH